MFKKVANSIEDLLELLAGLQGQGQFQIDQNDATIMHSVARQTFKGTALTDRQLALMKEKLVPYKSQFIALDYDFDSAIQNLRQPVRFIDRSKYIKIVDHRDMVGNEVYESYKSKWKWIEIRFPFAKKLIMKINSISQTKDYAHNKGSHKHFFRLTETNTFNIIEAFQNNDFDIDKDLLDYYNKIKEIKYNKDSFIPSIQNFKLCNLDNRAKELAVAEIGNLDKDSLIKYVDRKRRYGISDIDADVLTGDLSAKIALRDNKEMLFKPAEHRLDEVLGALEKLERYPILFVLPEKSADKNLYDIFNFYRNFLPAEQQSVLFRLDADYDNGFNQMVKDYGLNNWVDKNTKIVYINNSKLPKVLLKTDWTPITAFCFDSKVNRIIDHYICDYCDLITFYDDDISPFRRYSRYYG